MEPFRVPDPLRHLTDHYPDPRLMLKVAGGGKQEQTTLARLWLSEGIPHAFLKCPAVYDAMRCWLSCDLRDFGVHAKDIGLVGSARLGASYSPGKLGKRFSRASDLDIFLVSKRLFEALKEEFYRWSLAFESGKVTARNPKEDEYWRDNSIRVPRNILRGFLDTKFIPNLEPHPITRKINQCMFLLPRKLRCTPDAPQPKKASIRCYSSWDSFVRQESFNLLKCWEAFNKKPSING